MKKMIVLLSVCIFLLLLPSFVGAQQKCYSIPEKSLINVQEIAWSKYGEKEFSVELSNTADSINVLKMLSGKTKEVCECHILGRGQMSYITGYWTSPIGPGLTVFYSKNAIKLPFMKLLEIGDAELEKAGIKILELLFSD